MVSLREYAKNKGCSYEAVRKQVNRYKNEIEGHINKVGRTQYLDDEAVKFLDNKRADNPVVIMEVGKDEEIKRLQEENKNLLIKIAELQDALLHEKDQVKELQEQKIILLEQKADEEAVTEEPKKKHWWQIGKKSADRHYRTP